MKLNEIGMSRLMPRTLALRAVQRQRAASRSAKSLMRLQHGRVGGAPIWTLIRPNTSAHTPNLRVSIGHLPLEEEGEGGFGADGVLGVDVLSAMLNQAAREGLICGIKLSRACPSLTHCFFADDSLLFLNASKGYCEVVAGILKAYCEASGYLGLPTLWERSKVVALAFVKDRMLRKIQSWKQKTLTQAGREVLIKAVASSNPEFPMCVFKFPMVFCKELGAVVARFWWSGKEKGGKIHWQAWMLKGIYFPNGDLMEAKKGSRASWGWSSLLVGRDTLKLGIGWKEGRKVSSIISGNSWKLGELHNCLSSVEVKAIMGLHISSDVVEDERVWLLDRRGEYKVKSGYQIAKKALEGVEVARPSSSFLKVAEKVKHFIWRFCSNSLPSMVNLSKKRCLENASCPICKLEEETSEHLFLFCKWTKMVWFGSLFCARWNRFEVKRMEAWWSDLLIGVAKVDDWVASLFAYTYWHIWKERCKAIFDHGSINGFDNCVRSNIGCSFEGWVPPSSGVLKVNCDAAFDDSSRVAGIGVLVRDDKGRLVDGCCIRVKACSVNMAESLALKEALGIMKEILIMCGQLCWPSILHIKRIGNKAVDWVARSAVRRMCPMDWILFPPSSLVSILSSDSERIGVKTGIG
ncbi:uncharacterized protein G2W53_040771 [Senna tora]|uniref:Reverse transcriptase zinc-binding domain-containing protein n=1 Tax=Senna tora TaxID=362788 RepID=A0A834SFY1_9FABA|nr:uncharacterized protein G2W53_040771 [Senna tora]